MKLTYFIYNLSLLSLSLPSHLKRLPAPILTQIQQKYKQQKKQQLKPLNNIRARKLKQILLIKLLENTALNLREITRNQQRQQRLIRTIHSNVQSRNMQIKHNAMKTNINSSDNTRANKLKAPRSEPAVPV